MFEDLLNLLLNLLNLLLNLLLDLLLNFLLTLVGAGFGLVLVVGLIGLALDPPTTTTTSPRRRRPSPSPSAYDRLRSPPAAALSQLDGPLVTISHCPPSAFADFGNAWPSRPLSSPPAKPCRRESAVFSEAEASLMGLDRVWLYGGWRWLARPVDEKKEMEKKEKESVPDCPRTPSPSPPSPSPSPIRQAPPSPVRPVAATPPPPPPSPTTQRLRALGPKPFAAYFAAPSPAPAPAPAPVPAPAVFLPPPFAALPPRLPPFFLPPPPSPRLPPFFLPPPPSPPPSPPSPPPVPAGTSDQCPGSSPARADPPFLVRLGCWRPRDRDRDLDLDLSPTPAVVPPVVVAPRPSPRPCPRSRPLAVAATAFSQQNWDLPVDQLLALSAAMWGVSPAQLMELFVALRLPPGGTLAERLNAMAGPLRAFAVLLRLQLLTLEEHNGLYLLMEAIDQLWGFSVAAARALQQHDAQSDAARSQLCASVQPFLAAMMFFLVHVANPFQDSIRAECVKDLSSRERLWDEAVDVKFAEIAACLGMGYGELE
ncbi:hypothetical protein BDV95DRAFT_600690 [Massariosphaeria phaeospora]|uniref:Uncharacterized protein n=1 Tax=Massariosphaeria phaeospora TaxID=100035 RepID=A0A7C8IMK1_9PLEO|nr:hypothetical protein BDV95DRAFT_600690 [Massariosphaeria phaeospora]